MRSYEKEKASRAEQRGEESEGGRKSPIVTGKKNGRF